MSIVNNFITHQHFAGHISTCSQVSHLSMILCGLVIVSNVFVRGIELREEDTKATEQNTNEEMAT